MTTQTRQEVFKKSVFFSVTAADHPTSKTSAEVFTKLDFPNMNNNPAHSYMKILQSSSGHKELNLTLNLSMRN